MDQQLPTLDTHVRHRGTVESVQALLSRAGFEIVDVAERSFAMRFADGSALLRHWLIRVGFLPDWKQLVPPELTLKTFALLETWLNDEAERRGELALTIPVVYVQADKPKP